MVSGVKTKISTTQTSQKFSSKRRKHVKHKLNRETDIMLIVLSFSILISQMPCSIASYLIYYVSILDNSRDVNPWSTGSVHYYRARMPIIIYIIRLIEIIYFSLNFFFYITLSSTLRKEIKTYLSSYSLLKVFFKKSMIEKANFDDKINKPEHFNVTSMNNNKSHALEMIMKDAAVNSLIKNVTASKQKDDCSCSNVECPDFNSNNNSLIEYDRSSQNQMNTSSLLNFNSVNQVSKRVSSNSSDEYFEFIQKLRSISPQKRYPCLLTDNDAKKNSTLFKLESQEEEDTVSFNEEDQLVDNIMKQSDYNENKSNVRIIINNTNDIEKENVEKSLTDKV